MTGLNHEGMFPTGRNNQSFLLLLLLLLFCVLCLWPELPPSSRPIVSPLSSEGKRHWAGAEPLGRERSERGLPWGDRGGLPEKHACWTEPTERAVSEDRSPKWHHAGKQDRCKTDGQRQEGFRSESNPWFCYICVAEVVCVFMTVKFHALVSWPRVHGVRRRDEGKAALLYFSSLHLCRISKLLWCTGWCRKLKLSTLFTTGAAASCP